jgi:hypothetical protein
MDLAQLISQYGGNGIFFALFLYLFLQSNKESKDREVKYQQVITENQSVIEKFAISYEKISGDVCDIKQSINAIQSK